MGEEKGCIPSSAKEEKEKEEEKKEEKEKEEEKEEEEIVLYNFRVHQLL